MGNAPLLPAGWIGRAFRDLPGRTVRVKSNHSNVQAIGHIVKDDWFDPKAEFQALRPDATETTR